jgi:PKD repeat protein
VYFNDLSDGQITTWAWNFENGIPASSSSQQPIVKWNTPGTYTVSLTVNGTAGSSTYTQSIIIYSNLTVSVSATSSVICAMEHVGLTAWGASTYIWSNQASGNSTVVSPTLTTSYNVLAIDTNGCSNNNQILITVKSLPTLNIATSNSLICVGQSCVLSISGASSYTWSTGEYGSSITVTPSVTANYSVTGTDNNSCLNSTNITQNVSVCMSLSYSNKKDEIEIFPNPTKEDIKIVSHTQIEKIEVVAITGQVLMTEIPTNINYVLHLENFANGIYFVNIYQNNSIIKREKVVLNK